MSQGALGIVCAESDTQTADTLRSVFADADTTAAVTAERALLRRLEGGCQVPVAAYARIDDGMLYLDGAVASLDGSRHVRASLSGSPADAGTLGVALAETLLDGGAGDILRVIRTAAAPDVRLT